MEKKPVLLEQDQADTEDREPSDSKEIIASLARQFYGMGWFPGKVMRDELLPFHSKYRTKLVILQENNHS